MFRNAVGIILFIIAGLFVYLIGYLAYFEIPDVGLKKFLIIGIYCIPMIIFHLMGLFLYQGSNWKTLTGIMLLSACAFNVFITISFLCIRASPAMAEIEGIDSMFFFSDYLSGLIVLVLFCSLGFIFYRLGKSTNRE